MTSKAVILARGLGTRMRHADGGVALDAGQAAAAAAGLKAMMPMGRPFLEYVLSALADAGFEAACLVIGPEHDSVRRYFADDPGCRVKVTLAVQEHPLGTADAVLAAERFAGTDRFLVINGDNYYPPVALAGLRVLEEPAVAAFGRDALLRDGHIAPGRIGRFALLDIAEDGYVRRIVEKPDRKTLGRLGGRAQVSMNCWLFDVRIFEICRQAERSPRGELELPLAVQAAIAAGQLRVRALAVDGPVLDLSSRSDVAAVAERLRGVRVAP